MKILFLVIGILFVMVMLSSFADAIKDTLKNKPPK